MKMRKIRADKKLWYHPKFKKPYEGIYARRKGERIFELVPMGAPHGSKKGRKTMESFQNAKALGWRQK